MLLRICYLFILLINHISTATSSPGKLEMEGRLETELEVSVPAELVWDTYRGRELGKLMTQLLPDLIEKIELVEGDGGVGTVMNVVFPPSPGAPFTSYREKWTVVDDERRVKEVEIWEGGFLDFGFSLYRTVFEIIEVEACSSIIKSIIEYKVDNETNASMASIQSLEVISEAVGKYLEEKNG